ncbi:MAG: hypothetical protein MSB80_07095 [Alphaproteobacteria bacterium]|nr:hypothetical protein [Alphaproteobacteria bacterium]
MWNSDVFVVFFFGMMLGAAICHKVDYNKVKLDDYIVSNIEKITIEKLKQYVNSLDYTEDLLEESGFIRISEINKFCKISGKNIICNPAK